MASKLDMMVKIQKNIMDTNSKHIFSLSQKDKTKKLYTLHIYNDSRSYFYLNDNNQLFFNEFTKMLFDTNKKTKKGCFNQQYNDTSSLYNDSIETLTNRYLQSQYTFILINENCKPLSVFCINNEYIWNVCTHWNARKKGYMNQLLSHVLKLIAHDKLRINFKELRLTVKHNNPMRQMLLKFYKSFDFKIENRNNDEITMKYTV